MKILISIIGLMWCALGQAYASSDTDVIKQHYPQEVVAAEKLKMALTSNDQEIVADMIRYPLLRSRPLAPIRDRTEFLKHWQDYFDAVTSTQLIGAELNEFGWRGVALGNGDVWFQGSHITALNVETEQDRESQRAAAFSDTQEIHPVAQGFDRILFACETSTAHLRVQGYNDTVQLYGWKRDKKLTSMPSIIAKGEYPGFQGSGGNASYNFASTKATYKVMVTRICGEDCNHYFITSHDTPEEHREPCTETPR